jgi:gas vesicle protein
MKLAQMLAVSAVCAALLMGLSGCDMAEQAGRELAAKAEQSAKQMLQETLKDSLGTLNDSLGTLNEKLDQAQQSAETWLTKPPAPSHQPEQLQQPENPQPAAPSSTIET